MALLVDTSVWSLAYRRDTPPNSPHVEALRQSLRSGGVVTTGVVLLELLRGFVPPTAQATIRSEFGVLEFIEPARDDYDDAAALANTCRRAGVQLGTIDALIAQLAIAGDHTLLATDKDFEFAAEHVDLRLWRPH